MKFFGAISHPKDIVNKEYLDKRVAELIKESTPEVSIATADKPGVVKSSDKPNQIKVLEDGTMELNKLDTAAVTEALEGVVFYAGDASF